jgi:putative copper resistance protein D
MFPYILGVALHIAAAAAWVGGMLFFAVVAVPVLRRPEVAEARPAFVAAIGPRFRWYGWIALASLLVTGVLNLRFRGIDWATLADRRFWGTGFGHTLAWKLGFIALALLGSVAHELAARHGHGGRVASWSGRIVLLASVAVVFLAVSLVRGYWF